MKSAVYETNLLSLPIIGRGKVRDIYSVDSDFLLIVATDRLSAFDVILSEPIPRKGVILTRLSNFWFFKTNSLIKNHLTELTVSDVISDKREMQEVANRAVVVRRLKPLPIEAVVRGYIIGSGWEDYQKTGHISGVKLEAGLRLAEKLAVPIFTPSTKAAIGEHDENITFKQACSIVGSDIAEQIRDLSLNLYSEAAKYALSRGIIIADTKFEFGLSDNDELILIDELLTPDSSRFWPVETYEEGLSPESFDKQFVRDYLNSIYWDKSPPAPKLPLSIIKKTVSRYSRAYDLLTRTTS